MAVANQPAVGARPDGAPSDSASHEPALCLDRVQPLLRALAEPIRLQVVLALQDGERCVCDLTGDLDLAQSKLSFQFKLLKQPGLIRACQEILWLDDCLKLNGPSGGH